MSESAGSLPTYRWGWAPSHVATRRQLRAAGLRPGGADPVAQIRWRRGRRVALLYDRRTAVAVRPMTPAKARAVAAALAARRTCTACSVEFAHCLPTSLGGQCPACAEAEEAAVLAAFEEVAA